VSALGGWVKRRKAIASALVVAVIAGIPLTIAALHPGFPVSDVDLTSRDVWVTNGQQLLGGRLNRQIDELNGSVVAASSDFTVLQDGDTLFMYDPGSGKVESVSPASTKVTSAIDVPKDSEVSYGGTNLAIVSPKGDLWVISAVGDLQFNYVSTAPTIKLGKDGHAVVTKDGQILAVSADKKKLYRIPSLAAAPQESDFPGVGTFQLTAVGDHAVVLDQSTNELVTENGSKYKLDQRALRLQLVGADAAFAVVATGDSLIEVDLGSGSQTTIKADVSAAATSAKAVSAPVNLDGCVHGAWASAQRYVRSCANDSKVTRSDIEQPTQGSTLEFRVNRSVIVLNNLNNGNAWIVNENMRLVENWSDVTPPEEKHNEEKGDQKSATQSFKDTLAQRTENNRAPTAIDDDYGIRPGRTTILSVLDNDTDPDGDVLVISAYDKVADTTGTLDLIDGGRALQFTPKEGFVGTISFSYTVEDGRGGTAQARVTARVVPEGSNQLPVSIRESGISVEANQTLSYNVLTNWKDPDGDDLYLISASPKSGDLVRFTPDGFITFTHQTSELGKKEVTFQVSDGRGQPVQGTLTVDVQPTGSLDPIGTPDFASTFTGEATVIEPLTNDLSPSGAQLSLTGMEDATGGAVASFNSERGTITFSSAKPGIFYLKYTLAAGEKSSVGLVRIDVRAKPAEDKLPPIAVKDTAYLRGDQPVRVSVLDNDVSPSGRVLAVQSVDVPAALKAKGLVVELLANTVVRVTSPQALTGQVDFTYTISDGLKTATAGVTVVPVPALTKHQPPVAANDVAKVRAGDIITVDVLKNDFHPDDAPMTVDKKLVTQPADGLAFVNANTLRYQAPTKPGEYRVDYRVLDPFGESATATVTFTVTPPSEKGNRDPIPGPVVARVLAGEPVRVDIPLNGIDPDGDSAQLLGFPSSPSLGSVIESGPDYFIYQSSKAAAGTDQFTYQVYDAYGATGDGDVKIAVIPQPDTLQPPTAVPDNLSIRPGRTAQADLLANDSDPQGAKIKVSDKLVDVPKGIDAKVVDGQYLVVKAPNSEQSFSVRYELTNNRGGSVMSYALVKVTPDAPLLPPVASDYAVKTKDIAGKKSTNIELFPTSAYNPSGLTNDLKVSFEGPYAKSAENLSTPGKVRVTPGKTRQAIAYRVTNERDHLSAVAFILVPAAVTDAYDDPPIIDPALPTQYVSMNSTREWKLKDILKVPSGRDAWITSEKSVSSLQSNGEKNYVDKNTLKFTPAKDYRGPASINFSVTDGASLNDPKGNKNNLRLNIVVGDPEFRDTPPEFTTPEAPVEVGESTTIDLRKSTAHPNPKILQEVTYSDISSDDARIKPSLNGSELTITTPRNTPKGTTATLKVTLRWDKFTVPGTIKVTVVGSSKPLAVAVSDAYEAKRGDPATVAHPLGNDSNPFQSTGEPLTIVDAQVQNTGEPATISFTSTSVKIAPSSTLKSGVIEIVYTVEDATEDKDRRVNGTITLTVSDVPDQVQKPQRSGGSAVGGDGTATFTWQPPATNGKPITGYHLTLSPATVSIPSNCTTASAVSCTFTGLSNGTPYTITVAAENMRGRGEASPSSDPITPYGTPEQPRPTLSSQSKWAPATLTWTWPKVAGTGGNTTYSWRTSNGKTGSGVDMTSATISGVGAGNYSITVTATNSGGKSSAPGSSAATTVRDQPVPTAPRNVSTPGDHTGATTLTWSWNAPSNATADAAGDGLKYVWSVNGGAAHETSGTSASLAVGNSDANYKLTVYAKNSGGSGPSASSGNTHITRKADPTVHLSRGAYRTCDGGGDCYLYDVTLSDFGGGSHSITLDCKGDFGTFSFSGNSYTSTRYCGWDGTFVTVDGVKSNTVNFNP
jgi:hypothetical protein